jgi:hypothetical protein
MSTEAKWGTAVRVLAVTCLVLGTFAAVEAVALRRARAEVQTLRVERDRTISGIASAWTRQPSSELRATLRGLNNFYEDPSDGFGRPGGLCPAGHLDEAAIVDYVFEEFLTARGEGRSVDAALERMRTAIVGSEAYRAVHPGVAGSAAPAP